jgi:hypothetical protein
VRSLHLPFAEAGGGWWGAQALSGDARKGVVVEGHASIAFICSAPCRIQHVVMRTRQAAAGCSAVTVRVPVCPWCRMLHTACCRLVPHDAATSTCSLAPVPNPNRPIRLLAGVHTPSSGVASYPRTTVRSPRKLNHCLSLTSD